MKLYFEDGRLEPKDDLTVAYDFIVDAAEGMTANEVMFERIYKKHPHSHVYTNSLIALDNKYCWSSELGVPELYFRVGKGFPWIRVDELTDRELRPAHNLLKMVRGGEFHKLYKMRDGRIKLDDRT